MKKCVVFFVILSLIAGLFASCSMFSSPISGTEKAMRLLAQKRLQDNILKDAVSAWQFSFFNPEQKEEGLQYREEESNAVWTSFSSGVSFDWQESVQIIYEELLKFSQWIPAITSQVTLVDRWYDVSGEAGQVLLHVTADEDQIVWRREAGYTVFRRFLSPEGKASFEILHRGSENQKAKVTRLLCTPNEKWECTLTWEDGEQQSHLIVEEKNGYQNLFFVRQEGTEFRFYNGIITETAAYFFQPENPDSMTVFTPDLSQAVFTLEKEELILYPDAFEGFVSAKVPLNGLQVDENGDYAVSDAVFTLANQMQVRIGDTFGKMKVTAGEVVRQGDQTKTALHFSVAGCNNGDITASLQDFFTRAEITFGAEIGAIMERVSSVSVLREHFFSYFQWNGENLNHPAKLMNAASKEKTKISYLDGIFEEVKNQERVTEKEKTSVSGAYDFMVAQSAEYGNIGFSQGVVAIESLRLHFNDLSLLEKGERYSIHLTYVEKGKDPVKDGICISPEEGSGVLVQFAKGPTFSLPQSAYFTLPKEIQPGEYTLFAFAATQSGIRISQSVPLVFSNSFAESDTGLGIRQTYSLTEEGLFLGVKEKTENIVLEHPQDQKQFSYEEIQSILLKGVFQFGLPIAGAKAEEYHFLHQTASPIQPHQVLEGCVCRLPYLSLGAEGKMEESYLYVELIDSAAQSILKSINEARSEEKLPLLEYDNRLYSPALLRAKEAQISWSHVRPNGQPYRTVLDIHGISYMTCNEILHKGFSNAEEVIRVLLETEEYREILFDTRYKSVSACVTQTETGESYFCLLLMNAL